MDATVGKSAGKDANWLILALLLVDVVLLAIVELFFLPLRLDGTLLPAVNGFPVPVSIVIALLTTPLIIFQAAKLFGPRLAIVPLGVWIFTLLVVAIAGPGGDRVFVEDWRAVLLLAAGAFPGAMVLGGALGSRRHS